MRICVPAATDEGMGAKAFGHFGSAPCFIIYDTDDRTHTVVGNSNNHHAHGMCQPLDVLENHSVDIVVCRGMGARAVSRLNQGGIRAYRVTGETVEDVITEYTEGTGQEITPDGACSDHSCS